MSKNCPVFMLMTFMIGTLMFWSIQSQISQSENRILKQSSAFVEDSRHDGIESFNKLICLNLNVIQLLELEFPEIDPIVIPSGTSDFCYDGSWYFDFANYYGGKPLHDLRFELAMRYTVVGFKGYRFNFNLIDDDLDTKQMEFNADILMSGYPFGVWALGYNTPRIRNAVLHIEEVTRDFIITSNIITNNKCTRQQ